VGVQGIRRQNMRMMAIMLTLILSVVLMGLTAVGCSAGSCEAITHTGLLEPTITIHTNFIGGQRTADIMFRDGFSVKVNDYYGKIPDLIDYSREQTLKMQMCDSSSSWEVIYLLPVADVAPTPTPAPTPSAERRFIWGEDTEWR
jgi:hypothetical protein